MTQEDLMLAMKNMAGMNINVAGDFVMQKTVEHEVNNVEAGGIGIQNVFHNNADKPAAAKKNLAKNMVLWESGNGIIFHVIMCCGIPIGITFKMTKM